MVAQGVSNFFFLWSTIEKLLEHKGLKPKASLRREVPKGGRVGEGSPPPAGGGPGGLPREIFEKLPQNGAFWCILEQLLQSSKPKIHMKKIASLYVKNSY